MKTLDQHEKEAAQRSQIRSSNGVCVECPECKSELVNSWPGTVLLCDPPRISVYCEECGYSTSIASGVTINKTEEL